MADKTPDRSHSNSLTIDFPGASLAEGNRLAGSLAEALRDATPDVGVERQQLCANTQDFGASLAVIMGTAAATALAKAVATWLARNCGARIEIRRAGEVLLVATHLDSKDVPRIAEAFAPKGS